VQLPRRTRPLEVSDHDQRVVCERRHTERNDAPCRPDDAATFAGYIKRCLAPALEPGGVVVMENPGSHVACGLEEAIGAMGASVWWLPPHSLDLKLIEKLWRKIEL